MSELIERLRQHWLKQGIALGNGASESQVEELESENHIVLPDDFREYLLSISVREDWFMDDSMISFWTIKRIREEYLDTRNEETAYLAFADFLINSHEYAIKLQSDSAIAPVFFLCGHFVTQIASSFTEFLERYIASDEEMLIK